MANTEHILVLDSFEALLSPTEEQTSDVADNSLEFWLLDSVLFLDLLLAEFSKAPVSNREKHDAPTQ